jgi:DNA-binding HxlR family transcriptional regulator
MGRKAIMKILGILSGKQKEYNIKVLTLLYDNGPLSAWELTSKITDTGKVSLHATLNKRLRDLEKKGFCTE